MRSDDEEKENNHNTIMYYTIYSDRCKLLQMGSMQENIMLSLFMSKQKYR